MNSTSIPWVLSATGKPGYSWNPITGCLNHIDGMCKGGNFPCYAYKLANGRLRTRYKANSNLPCHDEPDHDAHHADPFYPRFWESKLSDRDLFRTAPRGIFVCDMSDLFGIGVPTAWTDRIMDQVRIHRQHRFYLLTKQPQDLPTSPSYFPDNAWVGVSATNREQYLAALVGLTKVTAKVKYISFEPLLEHMIDNKFTSPAVQGYITDAQMWGLTGIGWVIIGAQTKPTVLPKVEWVKEIVGAADAAGVPVFLKKSLAQLWKDDLFYPDWAMPQDGFTLRQEMPKLGSR